MKEQMSSKFEEKMKAQNSVIQRFYDKVYDSLEELDSKDEEHEALLIGTVQALVDKVSSSYGEDFHPYLIKDMGDVMHDFCNEYARSIIEESIDDGIDEDDDDE